MKFGKTHVHEIQIEFEEVDAGGVVHHPNYLKYYERARGAAINSLGFDYSTMWRSGLAFAVAEAYLAYKKPLLMYQCIFVCTRITGVLKSNLKVAQAICGRRPTELELTSAGPNLDRLPDLYHSAELRLVCVGLRGLVPTAFPPALMEKLAIPEAKALPPEARQVRVRS